MSQLSDLKGEEGRYKFMHWTPQQEESRSLVKIFNEKKLRRVAVFVFNQQGAMLAHGTPVELQRQKVGNKVFLGEEVLPA
ncbi:MAG: hypothetical protein V1746_04845 [bacterium]